MSERPRGTVTFLFTDVEGSTELLRRLRERYGAALAEHQRILREAFSAHGGEEVDTQGDAFFYVFSRAHDAALAGAEAQRALHVHGWPEAAEFRVRIGMHTGEAIVSEDGRYHGMGVHRTARIMAAGHGGQVLVSQSTASVLGDDELEGIRLRDLGEHNLKDLDRPERIYQLEIDGLPSEFAPLQTQATSEAAEELVAGPRPYYRRPLVIGAVAGVLAAAVAIPVFAFGGSSGRSALAALDANSVGVIDGESGEIIDEVGDVPTPMRAAVGEGAVWVTSPGAQIVSRIDPDSREVRQTIPVGSGATGIAVGRGNVWVVNTLDGTVSRINVEKNNVVQTISVGNSPTAVAFGGDSVWVASLDDQTLARIDARTGDVLKTTPIGAAARGAAVGGGAVWLTDGTRNRVVRVDAKTSAVTQAINVGSGPTAVAYGAGSVWVANSLDGTVSRIDPSNNVVSATIPVGSGPNGIAISDGDVWVSDETGGSLVRIDAELGSVTARLPLGSRPGGVVVAGDALFVTAQGSESHRGGTLLMRGGAAPGLDSVDPGKAYTPFSTPILSITNDGLLAFKRVGGSDGTQLVPDLATTMPTPTDDGKSYTFHLRHGVRFSNGKVVKPADVRHSIEREFAIPESPGPNFFGGLVGAAGCTGTPRRCDLSRGIVTDPANWTVTFHLTRADPEFPYKLATPAGAIVPSDAPRAESKTPLPATGPYVITAYDKHGIRLARNPYFHVWSTVAKPDGYAEDLRWTFEPDNDAAIAAVEHGRSDVLFPTPGTASARAEELATQFPAQVHSTPDPSSAWVLVDTHRPPFDDPRVRRAVNYALDRNKLVRLHGGPLTAQPSCQILPPNFPGYRAYCPYTVRPNAAGTWSGPDLAKANALVRASGTHGARIDLWGCPCVHPLPEIKYVRDLLERLGYRVTLHVLPDVGATIERQALHPQVIFLGWFADYPAASNFFTVIMCGMPASVNIGGFCDRTLNRGITRGIVLQQRDPQAARELWAKLDRTASDQAPLILGYTERSVELTSRRVGNYQHHPLYGILLDQLWVK